MKKNQGVYKNCHYFVARYRHFNATPSRFLTPEDSSAHPYSISKAIVSLLPSPCRATALSAARRPDTIDLEMELLFSCNFL
jgi:hypothetical protein